ncbi:uncharacterized protein LOC127751171 [Frankliniella occidentalis]|uniref:Uncharacterized protein LOC127751171 n=1 Tax=Frankliniella occidentalis TaxID=133901 RepID=A0A9C6XTB3_FRAOC|nr:uncharacterized protein LOC127751171 [Frankliniella occidentalis]
MPASTPTATSADADGDSESEEDDDPDDDVEGYDPIPMTTVLDGELDATLPPHQRCAALIVNLLGTQDIKVALELNANFKTMHESTTKKLKEWWRRQNRSDLVAAAIQEGLGVKLQVPGDTRWNSQYDARAQIVKLLDGHDQKLNDTLEKSGLTKLTSFEAKYLREYVWVMAPVAQALDILQRDKDMFIGYLIPTVLSMEKQLEARRNMDSKPLRYCDPLARTLKSAIREPQRFGHILEDLQNLHSLPQQEA